jgi:AAA domain
MALRITKASDPINVNTLVVCLYGAPGVGKTSCGFSAADSLLLDADHGVHRSKNRGDSVHIEDWSDIASIAPSDLVKYKTIVADTGGRLLDILSTDIIKTDPKNGRGGALTLQGYGVLKSRFAGWLNMIRSFGKDVVLLCHADEQRKGDELIERLDMQGSSKNEVYKSADVMGRIYLKGNKRMLNFSPTDTAFGKNPAQMDPIEIPDFAVEPNFLGKVIADVKASLNKLSTVQITTVATLAEWTTKIEKASTMADFDGLVTESAAVPEDVRTNVKKIINRAAKGKGYAWDAKTKHFDLAPPPKAA